MKYSNIVKGTFVSRPNRFVANVIIDNRPVLAHVKNTGRCRELLVPGATLYLEDYETNMRQRKLRYSIINVEKKVNWVDSGSLLVNMDSLAPNVIVREALLSGMIQLPGFETNELKLTSEKTYGKSRFDFFIEQGEEQGFIEVKGVTLEEGGFTMFPDAPTERGLKHVEELISAKEAGYQAFIIFVLQMEGVLEFSPNDLMHREFGDALRNAAEKGVLPLAFDCKVGINSLHIYRKVKIRLHNM